jgi:hypothetical protein
MESHMNDIPRLSKSIWGDKVLNDLNKLKVKKCMYLVNDKKVWCELVQKTKTQKGLNVRKIRRRRLKKLMLFDMV